MRVNSILVSAAVLGVATGHPNIVGSPSFDGDRDFLKHAMNKRGMTLPLNSLQDRLERRSPAVAQVAPRQVTQCGVQNGGQSCGENDCCSGAGFCGTGIAFCGAPDCQLDYGPACDGNQKPSGVDTSGTPRPKVGSVTYRGAGIYSCATTGEIAITYDDGPYLRSREVMDEFNNRGYKTTFFITGNNLGKGQINDPAYPWRQLVKDMYDSGHQIASHSWSHQRADSLTKDKIVEQYIYNEIAINDIIGRFPTYMRPPHSDCGSTCQEVMDELGYHITYFDLDSQGYLNVGSISDSEAIFTNALQSSDPATKSWLHIEHDIQDHILDFTKYMLDEADRLGFTPVTVGKCLNDPSENWYRTVSDDPNGGGDLEISTDATCGSGVTCLGSPFGNCCSQHFWCGDTPGHCDEGCQSEFGSCTGDDTGDDDDDDDLPQTTDSRCGAEHGTCLGWFSGECCSQHKWCGDTIGHCGAGCQPEFGLCN